MPDVFTPLSHRLFSKPTWSNDELKQLLSAPTITLPDETRFAGHWIVAPPGRGKTTLLHSMVLDDLQKDAAIVLIDSKGELINPFKDLVLLQDRALIIEPDSDFTLNPLDVSNATIAQAIGMVEYIMAGLLEAEFTGLQTALFRNVVPAVIDAYESPNLKTFKEVMDRGLPSLERVNPHSREFFENKNSGFSSDTYKGTRRQIVWRLDALLSNPSLRSMFSGNHTTLDLGAELDAGKVIIIDNSKALLGDEGAEFFGRFFIAFITRAAQQRSLRSSKKPCYVYIDECQSVIAKDARIPTLLDECRSQKIALILSHQRTSQLSKPVLDAVSNCAIRMANSDDEARYLALKLRMSAEELAQLPRGTFGTFIRDLTPTGIKVSVTKVDIDALPKVARPKRIRTQQPDPQPNTEASPQQEQPKPAPTPTPKRDRGKPLW